MGLQKTNELVRISARHQVTVVLRTVAATATPKQQRESTGICMCDREIEEEMVGEELLGSRNKICKCSACPEAWRSALTPEYMGTYNAK